jgi:preprotein translocase subunit SecA
LIISGPGTGDANRWFTVFADLVTTMVVDIDYEMDLRKRTISILDAGIDRVEDHLGIDNLYESENTPLISFLNNAIKASVLFKRDKDYVVVDGEVLIVDEHTGRILAGRRYGDGIHQSIEAKERVDVKAENQTLASVTLQNYFRLYEKLSGMTGTAETEAAEFMSTYKLGVVAIPTNRSMKRIDQSDLIYKDETTKFSYVVEDIVKRHATGQPVLVGTTSVEKSEYLSRLLAAKGIRHEVLNAKNHAREAAIVADAGRLGAVTVATNMAGRGTDVMLGGNAEFMAVTQMNRDGLSPVETPEAYESAWDAVLATAKDSVRQETEQVVAVGGLYVLGTERHESRRIDNQLRGRSGRQGDPGESRFYLSMTDDLMQTFGNGAASKLMSGTGMPDGMAIESKIISRAIRSAQAQIEGQNGQMRADVLKYDDVLNSQRTAIYGDRNRVLYGDDLHSHTQQFLEEVVDTVLDEHAGDGNGDDWDWDALFAGLRAAYPVGLTQQELIDSVGSISRVNGKALRRELHSDAVHAYANREASVTSPVMRDMERHVVLSVIDRRWRDHLQEMDFLKDGIGLRTSAKLDPLIEYQREGFLLYTSMTAQIREETVNLLFNLQVKKPLTAEEEDEQAKAALLERVRQMNAGGGTLPEAKVSYTWPDAEKSAVTAA